MRYSSSDVWEDFYKRTTLDKKLLDGLLTKDDFNRQLKNFLLAKKRIDERDIYNIARNVYLQKLSDGSADRKNTHCIRYALPRLSKEVHGYDDAWKEDVSAELLKLDTELWGKRNLCYAFPAQRLYRLFWDTEISEAFRKYKVEDDRMAYDACKIELFKIIKSGENDTARYFKMKGKVQAYAKVLGEDPDEWKKDYAAFLQNKVFTIRKAARGGGYEEIKVTEAEASQMRSQDEALPDVDEDL